MGCAGEVLPTVVQLPINQIINAEVTHKNKLSFLAVTIQVCCLYQNKLLQTERHERQGVS